MSASSSFTFLLLVFSAFCHKNNSKSSTDSGPIDPARNLGL
jgi:hypothetical protein